MSAVATVKKLVKGVILDYDDTLFNIGVRRLIKHLNNHNIPLAIASRSSLGSSLLNTHEWKQPFMVVCGGDEARSDRLSSTLFLDTARQLKIDPLMCLVIHNSQRCIGGAKAVGMATVAVKPTLMRLDDVSECDVIVSSLLDFQPQEWGLPPFNDWVCNTLPVDPLHIGGPVTKGFGRGSKILGIPTANLSSGPHCVKLSQYPPGVYFGWAGLYGSIYKMVMSIGWNPYFGNSERTIEPWLLHEFDKDFYGAELRLIVVGYIRPEENFSTVESLIERIHEDRRIAENALDLNIYSKYREEEDHYLKHL